MAWFDPSLYKPGNKRCPKCGRIQWGHLPYPGIFSLECTCARCHPALGADRHRFLLSSLCRIVLWCAYFIPIIYLRPIAAWKVWAGFAAFPGAMFLVSWWFESFKLRGSPEEPKQQTGVNPKG